MTLDLDLPIRLIRALNPESIDDAAALALYDRLLSSGRAQELRDEWGGESYDPRLSKMRRCLIPALVFVEQRFLEIPRQWTQVFWRSFSHKDDAEEYPEGRWPSINRHNVGIGAKIDLSSPDFIEKFVSVVFGMAEYFCQKEERRHADVLNAGRVYNPAVCELPLFSDEHPIDGSVYSNLFLAKPLTVRTYMEVRAAIGNFLTIRIRKILVPPKLEYDATLLLRDLGEARLDPPEGYQVLDFLSDPGAWFVTTTVPGLRSIEWQPFRLNLEIEDGELVLEGTQTYGAGHTNPRAVFGVFG